MVKMSQFICLMVFVLMTPLFSEIERVPIENRVYGIVHGENVALRAAAEDKARINTRLKNYEFVAVMKIGEGKEECWVKIYNIPGKEGWIREENVEILDKNNKEFMEIINNQSRIGRMLNSASSSQEFYVYAIKAINKYYYISYRTKDTVSPYLIGDQIEVYKHIDGSFREVAYSTGKNSSVDIIGDRMFIYDNLEIVVKDTTQYVTSKLKSDKYRYRGVARLSLNITKYLDSYMEFDPKTKIVTQYLRIKENQPYVIEKYQFKDDEFVQIGGRQHKM